RRGDSRLSKRLAWLLRHGATEQGFKFIDGCYLNVADVLAHQQFRGYTLDDIQSLTLEHFDLYRRVVSTNSKKRFELRSADDGALQIRAVQGHSIKEVDGLDLQPITADNCHQFPVAVHGTYMRHWRSISAQGLSRMNRTHIHFAVSSEAGGSDGGAISGLRQSADVLIF
uniref:2'-phosphotransferase n=1 Tax=Macrostomum lignano TaxID=282301 RepID=A0A1I8FMD8_9PLAT